MQRRYPSALTGVIPPFTFPIFLMKHPRPPLRLCALAHRLNFRLIEQNTATVSLEGGKADDFQIRVDLLAVIHNLQRLAEQRRALVDAQPFGVHIGENAAESVVHELFQRYFFDFCQRLVGVAEDPVHCGAFLVEHHLNVGKRKGGAVIAGIMPPIFFQCGRSVVVRQALRNLLPSGAQLFLELPFSSAGIIQHLAVDEFDLLVDGMDTLGRHQRGAVGADKAAAEHLRQLIYGGISFIDPAAGSMDDRLPPHQLNIENVICRQADVPAFGNDGNVI